MSSVKIGQSVDLGLQSVLVCVPPGEWGKHISCFSLSAGGSAVRTGRPACFLESCFPTPVSFCQRPGKPPLQHPHPGAPELIGGRVGGDQGERFLQPSTRRRRWHRPIPPALRSVTQYLASAAFQARSSVTRWLFKPPQNGC